MILQNSDTNSFPNSNTIFLSDSITDPLPDSHTDRLPDGGDRTKYKTGALRDNRIGKGLYVGISPIFLKELALRCEGGQIKYGNYRNWEAGMPLSRYIDAAFRHISQTVEGDDSENHAAAAAWNLMAFIHSREMIKRGVLPEELDDLPNYQPIESPSIATDINKFMVYQDENL